MIKIKKKKPFLAYILRLKFPMVLEDKVVMTWGDTIYAYSKMENDLLKHEKVHLKQQKYSKFYGLWWWAKYCFSTRFRLSQEVEAYHRQYEYYCRKNKNEVIRTDFLITKAKELSSGLYGNIISVEKAMELIENARI